MGEYGPPESLRDAPTSGGVSLSVLIGAVALIGVGLFGVTFWLVTQSWLDFLAVVPLVIGAYLLFTRGTGPDRA